jgi:hypothetical protein
MHHMRIPEGLVHLAVNEDKGLGTTCQSSFLDLV